MRRIFTTSTAEENIAILLLNGGSSHHGLRRHWPRGSRIRIQHGGSYIRFVTLAQNSEIHVALSYWFYSDFFLLQIDYESFSVVYPHFALWPYGHRYGLCKNEGNPLLPTLCGVLLVWDTKYSNFFFCILVLAVCFTSRSFLNTTCLCSFDGWKHIFLSLGFSM